mgnify:CR=1 FL=1
MDRVNRKDCTYKLMPGRNATCAFGEGGYVEETECMMGFVTFAPKYGEMEPHCHGTEIMYVEDAKGASVRYGSAPDKLDNEDKLEKGEVICLGDGEWHKFFFEDADSYVKFVVFMGGTPKTINASDLK